MNSPRSTLGLLGLLLLTATAACTAESDEQDHDEAAVTELKSYWADAKKLDLGDLTRLSVGYATDGLNSQLATPNFAARFEAPTVFAASAESNRVLPDGAEIKALDTVVTGLAARFGEKELGTEVNAARLAHLKRGADKYYVESGFTTRAGLDHGWSHAAPGFGEGGTVNLGIDAGAELSSRVIVAASDDKVGSLVKAPLAAAKEMRGFVYPRSVDDVRKMKPGEMFALRGLGKLGANFGVGAPILVAEPTGGVAYRVVVSAGVSSVIGGQLDVQLVRLPGDEVVVDVGVENGRGVSFHAAIKDGWGVKGICEDGVKCLRPVELGPARVDLSKLVEKAVEKRLNSYLSFKIEGQASNASSRVSLSRFRFHLDRGDREEVSRALEQALKFDVRLAQALYNRDLGDATPAVTAELDAVRAATTSQRSFGFELLGMNVYHRAVVKKEGSFVVQTPDGAKSILFDTVNQHGGWFQMDHGFTRTGVAAQTLDAKNPGAMRSEANLFVQTAVGDKHMDDDVIIDNVDALLAGVGGAKLVEAVDAAGNKLERMVWDRCPVEQERDRNGQTRTWDEQCNVKLLDDPAMKALKEEGMAAVEAEIQGMPADMQKLVRDAANVRLTLQSVGIHNLDAANGPNVSFTLDMRLDDKALDILTSRSKAQYAAALKEYLVAVSADRRKVGASMDKAAVRAEVEQKWGGDIAKLADKFEKRAKAYRLIADAERLVPVTLRGKRFASQPLGIRFSVDASDSGAYESAILNSTAHDRALAAAKLFDDLKTEADRINAPLYDEHTATYPLLQLVPTANLEVAMDVKADVKSTFWVKRERYLKSGFKSATAHAKGAEVSTISAGLFDLGAILAGN
ncbi:MAG: hypothetical protein JNL38_14070 [Myxococcales bacterium]|jgi:hypothetical protein|nr:hypothetical protein [Myxococcales bacterium]